TNSVQAADQTIADVGSLLPFADTNSTIAATTTSQVQIGSAASGAAAATLVSVGDVVMAARSVGILDANAQGSTYGLAGSLDGNTNAHFTPQNHIDVLGRSSITSGGDVTLEAGRDAAGTSMWF